jgi:plasmid stabilization system protein ParE
VEAATVIARVGWYYLIVYRVNEQDRVTILRVWHAAQDR